MDKKEVKGKKNGKIKVNIPKVKLPKINLSKGKSKTTIPTNNQQNITKKPNIVAKTTTDKKEVKPKTKLSADGRSYALRFA